MLQGWRWPELAWLAVACTAILAVSLIRGESLLGIAAALCGAICVVLMGKGRALAYPFAIVQAVLYAIISYRARLYGATLLNVLYYLPVEAYGLWEWRRHATSAGGEVEKRRLSPQARGLVLLGVAVGTAACGFVFSLFGDAQPWVDAFTTVGSMAAMGLSVRRYAEQWWMWIAVNALAVWMWYVVFRSSGADSVILVMWCIYTLNAVWGLLKWHADSQ